MLVPLAKSQKKRANNIPDRIVSLFFLEPAAEIGTIGLEGLPIDEVAPIDSLWPADGWAVTLGARWRVGADSGGALVLVWDDGAVSSGGVGCTADAEVTEDCAQVGGYGRCQQSSEGAQKIRSRKRSSGGGEQGRGEDG